MIYCKVTRDRLVDVAVGWANECHYRDMASIAVRSAIYRREAPARERPGDYSEARLGRLVDSAERIVRKILRNSTPTRKTPEWAKAHAHVAFGADGRVCGFVVYAYEGHLGRDGITPNVWITDVYVDPKDRRRGVGSVLLGEIGRLYGKEATAWVTIPDHSRHLSSHVFLRACGFQGFMVGMEDLSKRFRSAQTRKQAFALAGVGRHHPKLIFSRLPSNPKPGIAPDVVARLDTGESVETF